MKAQRRARLRKLAKWGGVVVCAVIVALWCVSDLVPFIVHAPGSAGRYLDVWVVGDSCNVRVWEGPGYGFKPWFTRWRYPFHHWWFGTERGTLSMPTSTSTYSSVWVPFWPLLLLAALPTAFLFWRDHRTHRPGRCPACGYDLAGNTSGVCPECGQTAKERAPLVR